MTLREYAKIVFLDHYGESWRDKLADRSDDDICDQLNIVFGYYRKDKSVLLELHSIMDRHFWQEQMGR